MTNDDRQRLNEHRRKVFAKAGRRVVFVCECADPDCLTSVQLTLEEYDQVRPGVVLAAGHEPPLAQPRPSGLLVTDR